MSGAGYGVKLGAVNGICATNVTVRGCEMRNCKYGFYMSQDNVIAVNYTNRLSHCVISNCTTYAIQAKGIHSGNNRRGTLLCDTSLIAGNKQAYTSDWQPPSGGKNTHVFINCTVVSNTTGFTTGHNLNLTFRNSIIADNGSVNISVSQSGALRLDHTLANRTLSGGTLNLTGSYTNFTDSSYLKFDTRRSRRYHPTPAPPACRFGTVRDPAADIVEKDLDGKFPKFRRWDAGCYFCDPRGMTLLIR